jgi:tight adherence protein B
MAGAVVMFLAFLIVTAYAVRPAEAAIQRRRSVLDDTVSHRVGLLKRLTSSVTRSAERVFASSERSGGLARSLEAAGIALRAGEYAVLVTIAVFAALAAGLSMGNLFVGLLLAVAAVLVPRLILAQRAATRRRRFGDQLDSTLQLLAGSLRAGYGLTQAMDAVASEAPVPTSDEFSRVVVETRLGRDMLDAMMAMSRRMDNSDMLWVAEAIGIQQRVGGDLSEVLETVAKTVRERAQIHRQVRALSAEGRISAVILVAAPFVLVGVLTVLSPGYLDDLYMTSLGRLLMMAGAALMIFGVVWVRRIIKITF